MTLHFNEAELLAQIKELSAQLESDPAALAFVPLATCYQALGLPHAALDAVRRGLEYHPQHLAGQLALADLLSRNGDYDEAVSAFDRVLLQNANHEAALLGLINLELHHSHYERAATVLERLAEYFPHHPDYPHLKKQLSELRCSVAEEEEDLALVTVTIAELYLKQGFKEKAIHAYRALLKQQPDDPLLQQRLQSLCAEQTRTEVLPTVTCRDDSKPELIASLQHWLDAIAYRRRDV